MTTSPTSGSVIPYVKVDEGYARLPGAGYEALHPELKGLKPEDQVSPSSRAQKHLARPRGKQPALASLNLPRTPSALSVARVHSLALRICFHLLPAAAS